MSRLGAKIQWIQNIEHFFRVLNLINSCLVEWKNKSSLQMSWRPRVTRSGTRRFHRFTQNADGYWRILTKAKARHTCPQNFRPEEEANWSSAWMWPIPKFRNLRTTTFWHWSSSFCHHSPKYLTSGRLPWSTVTTEKSQV